MADGIDRRTFLGSGVAVGIAGAFGPARLGAARPRKATPSRPGFELEEATIADLQAKMESGEDTARSLTEAYLERIETLDREGPALRALLEPNPDALEIADELDRERRGGRVRGPLHGIPVLLKDNIETADGMETTAGSLALLGARPARDAFVTARLREAGAVIVGKANLSEWANFRSTASSSGWSARGGQARNPYALDRKQFDAAISVLREQRKIVGRYWHDASVQVDDFVNEGVVASSSWPFQVNLLRSKKAPVASVIPDEGATGWADTTMLHVNAQHPNCAYRWMEHSLSTKTQGDLAAWFGSVPVVADACQGNALLGESGCETNGASNFDRIAFWRTPVADCGGGRQCVPYHEWVTSYIAVIGGR